MNPKLYTVDIGIISNTHTHTLLRYEHFAALCIFQPKKQTLRENTSYSKAQLAKVTEHQPSALLGSLPLHLQPICCFLGMVSV